MDMGEEEREDLQVFMIFSGLGRLLTLICHCANRRKLDAFPSIRVFSETMHDVGLQ